jgi:hypothetical protein
MGVMGEGGKRTDYGNLALMVDPGAGAPAVGRAFGTTFLWALRTLFLLSPTAREPTEARGSTASQLNIFITGGPNWEIATWHVHSSKLWCNRSSFSCVTTKLVRMALLRRSLLERPTLSNLATRPHRGFGTQKTHLVLVPNSTQPQKTSDKSECWVIFCFSLLSFQVLK